MHWRCTLFGGTLGQRATRGLAVAALIVSLSTTSLGGNVAAAPSADDQQGCSVFAHVRNESLHSLRDAWRGFRKQVRDLERKALALQHEAGEAGDAAALASDARLEISDARDQLSAIWSAARVEMRTQVNLLTVCKDAPATASGSPKISLATVSVTEDEEVELWVQFSERVSCEGACDTLFTYSPNGDSTTTSITAAELERDEDGASARLTFKLAAGVKVDKAKDTLSFTAAGGTSLKDGEGNAMASQTVETTELTDLASDLAKKFDDLIVKAMQDMQLAMDAVNKTVTQVLDAAGIKAKDDEDKDDDDKDEDKQLRQVKAGEFDPAKSFLVRGGWLTGIGCPAGDAACTTGDSKDNRNEGLLLVKTGPTQNFAAPVAELKNVKGIKNLTELGYDIRKTTAASDARGSHCGAGAPRFNVVTKDSVTKTENLTFIGCTSPAATTSTVGSGWLRLRWTGSIAGTVQAIEIVFDEGQDGSGGPDSFGLAVLDNVDVNGKLVGRGSGDRHDEEKDHKDIKLRQVTARESDPARTFLVQAAWLSGIGCATNATIHPYNPVTDSAGPGVAFTVCPTGDSNDERNAGLLLAKTGTGTNASAIAELKGVEGITLLTELGYDLRKPARDDVRGSSCGSAPRFKIVTKTDPQPPDVMCSSLTPSLDGAADSGWVRLRWNGSVANVTSITIVFDASPDNFGLAVLDNIDVNTTLVGRAGGDDEDHQSDGNKGKDSSDRAKDKVKESSDKKGDSEKSDKDDD